MAEPYNFKTVRMICNSNYQAHTTSMFKELRILNFLDINIYNTAP